MFVEETGMTQVPQPLLEQAREMRLGGAEFSDILKWSLNNVDDSQSLISRAFGIPYFSAIPVRYWHIFNGSYSDEKINDILEDLLAYTDFAAFHLIPRAIIQELDAHTEWLSSYGKSGRRLTTRALPNAWRRLNLSGRNLSGADLSGTQFARCNFSRCDLSGANIQQSEIGPAYFSQTDLSYATIAESSFRSCYVEQARIDYAKIRHTKLTDTTITSCSAIFMSTEDCEFSRVQLVKSDFSSCQVKNIRIVNSEITKTNLAHSTVSITKFEKNKTASNEGLELATVAFARRS